MLLLLKHEIVLSILSHQGGAMSIARFRRAGAILVGICFLFVGAVCAQQKAVPKKAEKGEAGEVKLTMKDLPKEVQATV
jgi:hypothetical protein